MDKKLKNTIDKIVQLSRENIEFGAELRRRLGIANLAESVSSAHIEHIEKYLGLDYSVDKRDSIIDYSYITISDVRDQLISDNREMMRYRYGTRYHMIDFKEFCRYAHLQAEMLLNYYYQTLNKSDLDAIKKHIKYYNKNALGLEKATSLGSISYSAKMWAFNEEHKDKFDFSLFENIRKVRNELSHRVIEEDQLKVEEYQVFLKQIGVPVKPNGDLDIRWHDENADVELKAIYNKKIDKTAAYKQYQYYIWYYSMPFEEIIVGLRSLSNVISNVLIG